MSDTTCSAHQTVARRHLEIERVRLLKALTVIQGAFRPRNQLWILGLDEGLSWCRACAEAEIQRRQRRGPKKYADLCVGGGHESHEADTSQICNGCGALLDYTLTDYGVLLELERFEGLDTAAPLTPHEAYELHAILEPCLLWSGCSPEDEDRSRRAVAVAKAFVDRDPSAAAKAA